MRLSDGRLLNPSQVVWARPLGPDDQPSECYGVAYTVMGPVHLRTESDYTQLEAEIGKGAAWRA